MECCVDGASVYIHDATDLFSEHCCCVERLQIKPVHQDSRVADFLNDFPGFSLLEHYDGGQASLFIAEPLLPARVYARYRRCAIRLLAELTRVGQTIVTREWLLLKQLQSPYVVKLLETRVCPSPETPKRLYTVMEYAEGLPLSHFIEHRYKFTEEQKKSILTQGIKALRDLQVYGVQHRDITPSNVIVRLLTPSRVHLRLVDFGLAKSTAENGTAVSRVIFKWPGYHPPELYDCHAFDHRSDQFSFAISTVTDST